MEPAVGGEDLRAEIALVHDRAFQGAAVRQFDAPGFRQKWATPAWPADMPHYGLDFACRKTFYIHDQASHFIVSERKCGHPFLDPPLPNQFGDF
jgi:hypothetical protein